VSNQRIVVNPERRRFYCWSWDKWMAIFRLRSCFARGCQWMYAPLGAHLRKDSLGLTVRETL
jgi:hypothetical protein